MKKKNLQMLSGRIPPGAALSGQISSHSPRNAGYILLMLVALSAAIALSAGAAAPTIQAVTFESPNDAFRFYHIRVALSAADDAFDVKAVEVAGQERLFVATVDGKLRQIEDNGRVRRASNGNVPAASPSAMHIKCPWKNDATYPLILHCVPHSGGDPFDLNAAAAAPAAGGFPYPGWREHRMLALREDAGIARANEPFLFFLSDNGRNIRSWQEELRIARYDLASHKTEEIPSQVLYEKRRFDTPKQEAAYATCQVAMLADVPAGGKAYYLIAYGNPDAEAPDYSSDLSIEGREDGSQWIENDFYELRLDPASGQIAGLRSKQFGAGEYRGFGLHEDSKYVLHYNPDVWVKGRSWTHTHGWNPPPETTTVSGPVAVVTRRWGHLPRAPEVEVEVTYHCFSHSPYCLVESTMDVLHDLVVNALRNEEVVFLPAEVDHAGWRRPNGELGYKPMTQEPGLTPGMVQIVEPDAPYVCMVREANGLGIASFRLSQHAGSRSDQDPVIVASMTILADYNWGFRYWSRALVYPWGDHLPDQPTILNEGTYYGEKSAFCLFPLGDGDSPAERLAYVEALYKKLCCPLRIDHQGAGPW